GIGTRIPITAPRMIGVGKLRDLFVSQLAVHAVNHRSHLACVNEERMAAPVAKTAISLIASKKPQTNWDLRRIEELARQCHHAVDQIGLDDSLANLTFTRLIRRH